MRHMELADLMAYHQVNYLRDPPLTGSAYDRLVETVLNLDDLVKRRAAATSATGATASASRPGWFPGR